MYVCNKDTGRFINIHEFNYSPGVFETLLFLPQKELGSPEAADRLSSLNRHKKEKKHMQRDQGIKCKNAETPLRRTKACTIQDMLRANAMTEGKDDADNPEEDCSAPECTLTKLPLKVSTGSSVKYVRNGTTSIV